MSNIAFGVKVAIEPQRCDTSKMRILAKSLPLVLRKKGGVWMLPSEM